MPEAPLDSIAVTQKFVGAWDASKENRQKHIIPVGDTDIGVTHNLSKSLTHLDRHRQAHEVAYLMKDTGDIIEAPESVDFDEHDIDLLNASIDILELTSDADFWNSTVMHDVKNGMMLQIIPHNRGLNKEKGVEIKILSQNGGRDDSKGTAYIIGHRNSIGFHLSNIRFDSDEMTKRQLAEMLGDAAHKKLDELIKPDPEMKEVDNRMEAMNEVRRGDPDPAHLSKKCIKVLNTIPWAKDLLEYFDIHENTHVQLWEEKEKRLLQVLLAENNDNSLVAEITFRNEESEKPSYDEVKIIRYSQKERIQTSVLLDHGFVKGGSVEHWLGDEQKGAIWIDSTGNITGVSGEFDEFEGGFLTISDGLENVYELMAISDLDRAVAVNGKLKKEMQYGYIPFSDRPLSGKIDALRNIPQHSIYARKYTELVLSAITGVNGRFDNLGQNLKIIRDAFVMADIAGGGANITSCILEFHDVNNPKDTDDMLTITRSVSQGMTNAEYGQRQEIGVQLVDGKVLTIHLKNVTNDILMMDLMILPDGRVVLQEKDPRRMEKPFEGKTIDRGKFLAMFTTTMIKSNPNARINVSQLLEQCLV